MDISTAIGTLGAGLILFAFLMNQSGRWSDKHIRYDGINFIGSIMLAVSAFLISSWPFLLLNLVWAAVSIKDVFVSAYGKDLPLRMPKPGQPSSTNN